MTPARPPWVWGWSYWLLRRRRPRGADQSEVIYTARSAAGRAQCLCLFETLEYLQKGGRIGRAQALVGSVLKIKPMIIVRDGEVHPLGRARTFPRALAKMKGTVRGFAPLQSLAVMHSTTPQVANEVADALRCLLPEGAEPLIAPLRSGIGSICRPGSAGNRANSSREESTRPGVHKLTLTLPRITGPPLVLPRNPAAGCRTEFAPVS